MERKSIYLIIALIIFIICIGVFWFQFNNDVATLMILNETQVKEHGSFKGQLFDSYGMGVANKTITYHKPGYELGTLADTTTDENGVFVIENAECLDDAGEENYYGNFTYAGDGKYLGCTYEGVVKVVA